MKSHNRTWLKAAAATVGAGALAFGGAVLPAAADESPEKKTANIVDLEGEKYELAAERLGMTVNEVKESDELVVSDGGFVFLKDLAKDHENHDDHDHSEELAEGTNLPKAPEGGAPIPGNPTEGSRPGAPVTVYLDFDGETLEGTNWNDHSGSETLDFAPLKADDAAFQEQVWKGVAEDYAPFNVNVTTTRPSDDALYKTSEDDNEYASHVIITSSYSETLPDAANTSGLAWVGGTGSDYLTGALVFPTGASETGDPADAAAKDVAFTATHESGHNFGLSHHGFDAEEYYVPEGGLWGPIMGAPYNNPISQWSDGSYAGASNPEQDDLAVISDRSAAEYLLLSVTTQDGEPYDGNVCYEGDADPSNPKPGDVFYEVDADGNCTDRELVLTFTFTDRADRAADQVGNTAADAAELDNSATAFSQPGVIETGDDVDVYSFTTIGGPVTLNADAADEQANLDVELTLTDADGNEVAASNPDAAVESTEVASGLDASITEPALAPGTYYVSVEGAGFGDPSTATAADAGGYSAYGSLGNYTLSGEAAPFVFEDLVITSPEDGAEVTGGENFDVTGTGEPGADIALSVGGDVVAETTVDAEGNWTAQVPANQYGETEVTAAQTLDGIKAGTATVTVVAPVDAPVITSPENESTTEDTTPTISGTGIAGAEVELSIVLPDGDAISATVTVDADGNWEYTPESAWEAGTYGVAAAQTINGTMSDVSNAVQFAIEVEDSTDDSGTDGTDGTSDGDTDGSTDDSGTDGSSDDSSTDDAGTDGSTDDSSTDGGTTDGDDSGTDEDTTTGTELAVTGAEIETAPIVMLALGLLVVGAGTAAFAIRQRKLSAKE
ncbi:Ig-like domain-containing protein [Microbacterium halophytorum]|uniref:Ig-like domain-containing protein n=1 Tax=Microbacterium halophytorum TaxID=2067568 RepID=UPI000CFD589B|nr:Ig-like domain-containing protein [Microbacterium halophytorum]